MRDFIQKSTSETPNFGVSETSGFKINVPDFDADKLLNELEDIKPEVKKQVQGIMICAGCYQSNKHTDCQMTDLGTIFIDPVTRERLDV